jgi:hypothetical protein
VGATCATPTEAAVVAAVTVAEGVEFESFFEGDDAGLGVSAAAVLGAETSVGGVLCGVGSVSSVAAAPFEVGSVATAPECAPPLLLIVTPGATSVVDDVALDVADVSATVAPLPMEVGPVVVGFEGAPAVTVDADGVPVVDDDPADVDEAGEVGDSAEAPVVSAADTP